MIVSLAPARPRGALSFIFIVAGILALTSCSSAPSQQSPSPSTSSASGNDSAASTPIRVTINGQVLHARLWDNAPARDLLDRLPLTVRLQDVDNQEKVGYLPKPPLSADGMPEGDDPQPGDIGWFRPWNTLAFYYGDVSYSGGIARIGRFDDPIDLVKAQTGFFHATIERAS